MQNSNVYQGMEDMRVSIKCTLLNTRCYCSLSPSAISVLFMDFPFHFLSPSQLWHPVWPLQHHRLLEHWYWSTVFTLQGSGCSGTFEKTWMFRLLRMRVSRNVVPPKVALLHLVATKDVTGDIFKMTYWEKKTSLLCYLAWKCQY